MSQYQDYFFSDAERQEECSMLKSPFMNDDCMHDYDSMMNPYFEKDQRATAQYNDVTEIEPIQKKCQQNLPPVNFKKHKRIKRNISTNQEKKSIRKQIFKGLRNDTIQLNTNFKGILLKKLKQLSALRQLESKQKQIIFQFGKAVPSFVQLRKLRNSEKIAQKSLCFIKSSKIVTQLLNGNHAFQIKMTMLKYIQALKLNFQSQKIIKWKDIKFE